MAKVKAERTFIKGQEESTEGAIQVYGYSFKCPGCGSNHVIPTNKNYTGYFWGFNNDIDNPTFTPSLLVKSGHYAYDKPQESCWCTYNRDNPDKKSGFKCGICHSFIINGKID